MVGVSLAFVGITLILNGMVGLKNWNKKDLFLINILTGSLIAIFNIYALVTNVVPSHNIHYFGALLFAFTNFFVAIYAVMNVDKRSFGWFCLFATLCAIAIGIYLLVTGVTFAGVMWLVWSLIWLFAFFGYAISEKFEIGASIMFIIQGVITTLTLGFLIMTNVFTLY